VLSLDIFAVCRAFASAQKTPHKPAKTRARGGKGPQPPPEVRKFQSEDLGTVFCFGGSTRRFVPHFQVLSFFWILLYFTPKNTFFRKIA